MLKEEVRLAFNNARKAGDHLTKDALEAVIAGILQKEKSVAGHEVTDAEVIECVSKEIKVQKEVKEMFAGRNAEKEAEAAGKIEILTKFLPEQLTEEAVMALIEKVDVYPDASPKTKGMIIKAVMPQIAGKFDKALVNGLVEKHLANK
ncbi:MAG: GatB/YqeY domain-containing protein [Eubacteriales bacterium]|nr:GatB/YqeY domain-containing protein [Eubacteriales bacterium]